MKIIIFITIISGIYANSYIEDLNKLEKTCSKGNKSNCYSAKRYKVFKKACDSGDKHSCGVLSDLREFKKVADSGDVSMAQSFDWLINNGKTTKGK